MPCDSVTSADHLEDLQLNRVKPYLADLQARSRQRIEKDKDFSYVREDIEGFRKEQADKSLSLNEAERVAEQKAETARVEARKKERLSRKKPNEKLYEITLKNVDLAQLQPLASKSNTTAKNDSGLDSSGVWTPLLDDVRE